MENLELRMYGLVPYNISPIQQGIQFGHAVVEYGRMIDELKIHSTGSYDNSVIDQYKSWADKWKTFIILNGGTTNSRFRLEDGLPFGTLNQHALTLAQMGVELATFKEPDLGDQLTAVVFIVDDRVFDKETWPDWPTTSNKEIMEREYWRWKMKFSSSEGEANRIVFLRELLSKAKLA